MAGNKWEETWGKVMGNSGFLAGFLLGFCWFSAGFCFSRVFVVKFCFFLVGSNGFASTEGVLSTAFSLGVRLLSPGLRSSCPQHPPQGQAPPPQSPRGRPAKGGQGAARFWVVFSVPNASLCIAKIR